MRRHGCLLVGAFCALEVIGAGCSQTEDSSAARPDMGIDISTGVSTGTGTGGNDAQAPTATATKPDAAEWPTTDTDTRPDAAGADARPVVEAGSADSTRTSVLTVTGVDTNAHVNLGLAGVSPICTSTRSWSGVGTATATPNGIPYCGKQPGPRGMDWGGIGLYEYPDGAGARLLATPLNAGAVIAAMGSLSTQNYRNLQWIDLQTDEGKLLTLTYSTKSPPPLLPNSGERVTLDFSTGLRNATATSTSAGPHQTVVLRREDKPVLLGFYGNILTAPTGTRSTVGGVQISDAGPYCDAVIVPDCCQELWRSATLTVGTASATVSPCTTVRLGNLMVTLVAYKDTSCEGDGLANFVAWAVE